MIKLLTFCSLFIFLIISCQNTEKESTTPDEIINLEDSINFPLIPYPQEIKTEQGYFTLNKEVIIKSTPDLIAESNYLAELINASSNFNISDTIASPKASIHLQQQATLNDSITNKEAYTLVISPDQITITGCSNTGVMRGIQTLRQLFVLAFHQQKKRDTWYLPSVKIVDFPKFEHRGMLLDVCRHFFEKDVILKYIDALAFYKMNVFHFHLTEDQGWRIPIDKYPLLTEIGAWRLDTNGNKYGGHYTKEELKEIVSYANERHITVIPEIELPGHSQAAIAAYPKLSCTELPVDVVNDWGVFKEIYCAGKDSTFIFIENVLKEVMEIFPSEYIHIGGDEAPKFRWEHCDNCQKRMKDENLKDEHALQSYFIKRIERFLNENGRKLIGWDEILEGGLSANATVQSWRGFEGGIEAASTKHNVIMSPTSHCYLDYSLQSIDLKKIYEFDPIPAELEADYHEYIIGSEGNMWTEHVPNELNLDNKVFPRIIGLAEVLWTYDTTRRFEDFYLRIQNQYPILKSMHISSGLETVGAFISDDFNNDSLQIVLHKNLPDLTITYAWNDEQYKTYTSPILLNKTGILHVQALRNDTAYGDPIQQEIYIHEGVLAKVTYNTNYNKWYSANEEKALVDGKIGSLDFRDGNWQGFWGTDIDVQLELNEPTTIHQITTHFYQYANSWIFAPKKVYFWLSQDGKTWIKPPPITNEKIDLSNQKSINKVVFSGDEIPGIQFIRIKAINIGKVPDGHEAAGSDAWVFLDEIQIN